MCRSEGQLPEVVLTQFVSPDDEHDVLETCRELKKIKYIEKNCASRWSFTENHYMMQVNKTLNLTTDLYPEPVEFSTQHSLRFTCIQVTLARPSLRSTQHPSQDAMRALYVRRKW